MAVGSIVAGGFGAEGTVETRLVAGRDDVVVEGRFEGSLDMAATWVAVAI